MNEKVINECLRLVKSNVRRNLASYHNDHHIEAHHAMIDLFDNLINNEKSNSIILIGPRAVGKTFLVDSVSNCFKSKIHVVKLNGFIHTTDAIALKSLVAQLHIDEALGTKLTKNFSKNLSLILDEMKSVLKTKALVIVIEEIDLFCAHFNQTLLYNLFEMVTVAKQPILLVGITCRFDIMEMFEKRVKSRLSQRKLLLLPINDFTNYFEAVSKIFFVKKLTKNHFDEFTSNYILCWNTNFKELIKSSTFRSLFQKLFIISNNARCLNNFVMTVLSRVNEDHINLSIEDFEETVQKLTKSKMVNIVKELSILELCLMIVIMHHDEIHATPFNFELVFHSYLKVVPILPIRQISQQRSIVSSSFEKIRTLELIKPTKLYDNMQKEFVLYKLNLMPQEIVEGLKQIEGLPTGILYWATNKPMA